MRFSFEGRGKSGGARILYLDILVLETVMLLGAYAKNEQETLTSAQKDVLKSLVRAIKNQYGK
jgi:hypothetical protein